MRSSLSCLARVIAQTSRSPLARRLLVFRCFFRGSDAIMGDDYGRMTIRANLHPPVFEVQANLSEFFECELLHKAGLIGPGP